MLLDILKGFVPVFIASYVMDRNHWLFPLVIVAPVLGHAIGMFNHFHGGKCIATSFGVTAGLIPMTLLIEDLYPIAVGCALVAIIANLKHILPLVRDKKRNADMV